MGHFVYIVFILCRGDEDIPRCTHVRCMETLKNCDELIVRNEDGFSLRVAQLPGILKIDPFLNILDVYGEFRWWGQMNFHLHMVGPS